jgi:hypothetical protein
MSLAQALEEPPGYLSKALDKQKLIYPYVYYLPSGLIRKYRSIGTARKPRVNILVLFSMPSSLN